MKFILGLSLLALAMFAPSLAHSQTALEFTQDDQAVHIPNQGLLDFKGDFTIEAWIKPYAQARDHELKFILSKNYGGTGFALLMRGLGNNQLLQFEANSIVNYRSPSDQGQHFFHNQWIHLAGIVKGDKMALLINGALAGESPKPGPTVPNNLPLWIGSSPWGGFKGLIDEVRIWDYARTHADITQNMHRRISAEDQGILINLRFDEGTGVLLQNNAPYRINAALTNRTTNSPLQGPLPVYRPGVPLGPSWGEQAANSPKVDLTVNDNPVPLKHDEKPILFQNRIYAVVCTLSTYIDAEIYGNTLSYPKQDISVTVKTADTFIRMPIGSFTGYVNDQPKELPGPAFSIPKDLAPPRGNPKRYPLRFVIEELGGKVTYDPETKTAHITLPSSLVKS